MFQSRRLHNFKRLAVDSIAFLACAYVVFVLFTNIPFFVDSGATFNILAPTLLKLVVVLAALVAVTQPGKIIPFLKSPAAILAIGIGLIYFYNSIRIPVLYPDIDELILDVTANRLERFIVFPSAAFIFFAVRFRTIELLMTAAVVLVVFPVFVNFFNPGLHEGFTIDRAVGTYGNANQAAEAILLWLAVIQHRVKGWPLFILFLVASAAIILTFSRSGMLGCFLMLLYLIYRGRVSKASFALPVLLIVFYSALLSQAENILPLFIDNEADIADMIDRLNFLGDVGSEDATDDNSAQGRMQVASDAFSDIMKKPISGYGIETEYNLFIASHNSFLELWYIYGLLGVLIFFWIVRNLFKSGFERGLGWFNPYAMLFLLFAPFDHQHLTAIFWLMFYAYAMKPISSDVTTAVYSDYQHQSSGRRRRKKRRRRRSKKA